MEGLGSWRADRRSLLGLPQALELCLRPEGVLASLVGYEIDARQAYQGHGEFGREIDGEDLPDYIEWKHKSKGTEAKHQVVDRDADRVAREDCDPLAPGSGL